METLRKYCMFVICISLISFTGCFPAFKSQPTDNAPIVLITPNPEERASYMDVIRDEYPGRYPKYDTFATVESDAYSLSLPKGWRLEEKYAFPNIYNESNEVVGEIYTQSIGLGVRPPSNHTGLLESGKVLINSSKLTSLIFAADYPAASGIERIDIKQSICFIINKDSGCFLTLYKAYYDRNAMHYIMTSDTVLQIAKSFRIR